MAYTTQLLPGINALVQSVIYALPPKSCLLFTDSTTATIEQSTTVAFTASVPVVLTAGQMEVAGGFIRCTTGAINVVLKENP